MNKTHAQRLWDSEATRLAEMADVSVENNGFLQLLDRLGELNPQARVLDIGCGAGRFTVAVARRCKEALGVDLSEAMISEAQKRAHHAGLTNTRFICGAWQDITLDDLGSKAFDTVFAHMTDAINNRETARKMTQASKNLCVLQMWQVRRNAALKAAGKTGCVDFEEVVVRIKAHEEEAYIEFKKMMQYLSTGIINLIYSYNPSLIILGDEMSRIGMLMIREIKNCWSSLIQRKVVDQAQLCLTSFDMDPAFIGAAEVAIDYVFGHTELLRD